MTFNIPKDHPIMKMLDYIKQEESKLSPDELEQFQKNSEISRDLATYGHRILKKEL